MSLRSSGAPASSCMMAASFWPCSSRKGRRFSIPVIRGTLHRCKRYVCKLFEERGKLSSDVRIRSPAHRGLLDRAPVVGETSARRPQIHVWRVEKKIRDPRHIDVRVALDLLCEVALVVAGPHQQAPARVDELGGTLRERGDQLVELLNLVAQH